MQTFDCIISYLKDAGDTMLLRLVVRDNSDLAFLAGQYLMLAVPGEGFKPFSIASSPVKNYLELHIRDNPDNDLKQQLHDIYANQGLLTIQLPAGECTLKRINMDKPILFIAGGTGYAPCHAMIQELFSSECRPSVSLYWGGAELRDLYLNRELVAWASQQLGFSYTAVVQSESNQNETLRNGLVHEAVLADIDNLADYDIFVSGSGPMVGAVYQALVNAGANADSIYSDMLDLGYAEIPQ